MVLSRLGDDQPALRIYEPKTHPEYHEDYTVHFLKNELAHLEDKIAHLRVLGGPSLEAVEVVRGQEEETFLWNSYECLYKVNGNVSVELM